MRIPRYLGSSVNPEKLSLTLKGLVPLIVALLPIFGVINIGESEIVELINAIVIAISGAVTLYGIVRKITVKFGN